MWSSFEEQKAAIRAAFAQEPRDVLVEYDTGLVCLEAKRSRLWQRDPQWGSHSFSAFASALLDGKHSRQSIDRRMLVARIFRREDVAEYRAQELGLQLLVDVAALGPKNRLSVLNRVIDGVRGRVLSSMVEAGKREQAERAAARQRLATQPDRALSPEELEAAAEWERLLPARVDIYHETLKRFMALLAAGGEGFKKGELRRLTRFERRCYKQVWEVREKWREQQQHREAFEDARAVEQVMSAVYERTRPGAAEDRERALSARELAVSLREQQLGEREQAFFAEVRAWRSAHGLDGGEGPGAALLQ